MAGEFVIEALEPRQLLSGSAASAVTPAVATAVVVNAASSSASLSSALATVPVSTTTNSASTATASTTTAAASNTTLAFVRPGDNSGNDSPPAGSQFGWGTDIYPPPVFTGTGKETSRTTVTVGPTAPSTPTGTTASSSTTTATSSTATTSATVTTATTPIIVTGAHHGKTAAARHFSVRPTVVETRPAHSAGSADSVAPPAIAPPAITPVANHPQHFPAGTFAGTPASVVSSPGLTAATPTTFAAPPGSTPIAPIHFSAFIAAVAAQPGTHARPLIAPASGAAVPIDAPAPANAADRAMRSLSRPDLSGLLLPLATMDTLAVGDAGSAVGKWEVDVAVGSLTVVIAGYYYLADAAARRRRQRALAVSVFCDKPVE